MQPPEAITCEQARRFDRRLIDEIGICGLVLMENAGRQCADAIERLFPDPTGSAAILAGAGNNGGDGFVIARHLLLRGRRAEVFLLCDPEKISGDARANLDIVKKLRCPVHLAAGLDEDDLVRRWSCFDLLIDAIGGTGISGTLRGGLLRAVQAANRAGRPIVAVDIPTGLDADAGEPRGQAVRARATVTFIAPKIGMLRAEARAWTGELIVADIGVSPAMLEPFHCS